MKNNKMISEFMRKEKTYDIVDVNDYRGNVTLSRNLNKEEAQAEIDHFDDRYGIIPSAVVSPLKYHESWDALMPVVLECSKLADRMEFRDIENAIASLDLDTVYDAVVDFITQRKIIYNQK